ncbi:hypothetical protein FOC4_g10006703 [Fusarium odoratissimum]|uniref:Uncharacterized protein n=1 Tax=Fusarium oxysporum f. sp. cubense (strain race 4) TaxID=2502994 RepID=N1RQC9_FUSC4|nr:hypothetical protein FOC4_g10006703 [Fusarium odoratissimum]
MNRHQYPLKESPDGSSPISLFPQMPLRDLDSEVENIEKLFLLGLSQPAQERDGLKELEANFKESRRQATYRLLSLAPKEISDYYQQLIQRTQFNEDLGRWKTLSTQNQPDPFGLFQEVVGAAFALKSSQGLRPSIQEIYDRGPDLDASENTIDNLFGASEDHQAPDQHDSGISMGTSVEDSMYYQMPDEGADNP